MDIEEIYRRYWLPLYGNLALRFHAFFMLVFVSILMIDGLPVNESALFSMWFGVYVFLTVIHYISLLKGNDIFK